MRVIAFLGFFIVTTSSLVNTKIVNPKIVTPKIVNPTVSLNGANPNYSYGYNVQDAISGDYKSQRESRDGDIVRGSYSFMEADGSKRIVNYIVHPLLGFNAIVLKERAHVVASNNNRVAKVN